jgi:hypothetical protein
MALSARDRMVSMWVIGFMVMFGWGSSRAGSFY